VLTVGDSKEKTIESELLQARRGCQRISTDRAFSSFEAFTWQRIEHHPSNAIAVSHAPLADCVAMKGAALSTHPFIEELLHTPTLASRLERGSPQLPARRRSLCLRMPQSRAREQSPTPNSLPTPCCPRGGADYLPPSCARYPTSAPAAVPIAPCPCAPGTPPLPRRHCRLPLAIVRPVPYLCPRGGAGRLPHWPALVLPVPHLCPRDGANCIPHWRARNHAFAAPHLPTAAHLALHHSHPPPSPPPCRATSYLPPDSFHRHHWPSLVCSGVIHAPPCPPPIPQIVSCLGLRTCMPRG